MTHPALVAAPDGSSARVLKEQFLRVQHECPAVDDKKPCVAQGDECRAENLPFIGHAWQLFQELAAPVGIDPAVHNGRQPCVAGFGAVLLQLEAKIGGNELPAPDEFIAKGDSRWGGNTALTAHGFEQQFKNVTRLLPLLDRQERCKLFDRTLHRADFIPDPHQAERLQRSAPPSWKTELRGNAAGKKRRQL